MYVVEHIDELIAKLQDVCMDGWVTNRWMEDR